MRNIFFISIVSSFLNSAVAAELTGRSYLEGLESGFSLLVHGSHEQFREKNNLYALAAAIPSFWFSFEEDERITALAKTKSIPKYMQIASDISPALSFPVIPFVFYSYAVKYDDTKSAQFAKELFASMYLALIESAALSVIDIHERPDSTNLSKWETNFRGKSSFPSGHVVPYATLTLKTFQFYGPKLAIIPGALLVATSIQRVRDQKHYLSDVVGGVFLSIFAAEGVRKAGGYKDNHETYRLLFEHNVVVGVTSYQGTLGPRLSWDW